MNNFCKKHNLFYRLCSGALIVLHLITFGPVKDAFAFSAQSENYKLSADVINEGGKSRGSSQADIAQDSVGEPCAGRSESENFVLDSGFIPLTRSIPPALTQNIPYQHWTINTAKNNAFDLDDYFSSPEGYPLTFSVKGNSRITVAIDPSTRAVSFSQSADWFGVEKIYFIATDAQGDTAQSNEVALQVANAVGSPNKPVIIDKTLAPVILKEGDLVKLVVRAHDLDGQDLTFSYGEFFTETRSYKDGDYWYSESAWQTGARSTGHYIANITVSDGALTDTSSVLVNIGNFNRPPLLEDISDITVNEGDLAVINPRASDPDNDPVVFYYSAPFDAQGKWLVDYDSAGERGIQVTASDGIDTVSKTAKVIINNTNRSPRAVLTLSKYTVLANEEFNITLSASDPDGDSLKYVLKKDGVEFSSGDILSPVTAVLSFSDLGDHVITAVVTDGGGMSDTQEKGVDVTEPAISINPVMGDFNGDALTDLGLHNSDTGTWEVCVSDKGVFRNAVAWLTGFGASKDSLPMGGDFNGDGKTDTGIYNYSSGELKVALSSSSKFSAPGSWFVFSSPAYSWQPFTGNFNGDKFTDIAFYNNESGEIKAALGNGSGFGALTSWLDNFGAGYTAMSGDFNGDGLSDLCLFKKTSGEFKIAFSSTSSFVGGSSWISGFAVDKDALISDFNNDGLTDTGYWDKASGKWYYAISTGVSFIDKGLWLDAFGQISDESVTTGDFDGNGITDAACFDRDQLGINRWTTRLSTDKPADLLVQIDNGIGGKTKIAYTYAAKNENSGLPFPVYVASGVSLENTVPSDRRASYSQDFSFSGGYYDAQEREFRGFARARVTDPVTKNYSDTYFYQGVSGQDGALKGQIDKIIAYDGNGRKISQTVNTYEVKKSGPLSNSLGFPALVEQNTTVWEENNTCLSTRNKITYDSIGNAIETIDSAQPAVNNTQLAVHAVSSIVYTRAYEAGFNRPAESLLKDKDGNIVSKKTFAYDNKGNLAKATSFIFSGFFAEGCEGAVTDYSYDSFGNTASVTNALGNTVTTEYETDFYAFPQKTTNSLGHSVRYVYEPKFGAVKSTTDSNGAVSSVEYDSLGRVTRELKDDGQGSQAAVLTYAYPDFNTKTSTNSAGLYKTEYIDGLGRKYKTVSSGEDGADAREITSEVFYNERGFTEKESLPHYAGEDLAQISYSRYEYDIRGRVKKTIADFPGSTSDAVSSVSYINPLYTESTDPLGNRKGVFKDAYGNILEVTDFVSGGVLKTGYEYDLQNNLTMTTDNQGNITRVFYDSLGRKTRMVDPDMGEWIYEYDILGNLKKQTDAKGQVLNFEYDALNRLVKKSSTGANSTGETVLSRYLYDDSSKDNCIGRLSKVTDQSGSTEFFYDKLGREIKSIKAVDSVSYAVERTYDILDRLTALKYPDGEVVSYSYDVNSGALEKVQGSSVYVKDMAYNAKGQAKSIWYGNDVRTAYTYGQDLRLRHISTRGSANLQDLNYTFDHNGNLTVLTDNLRSNTRAYVYDGLGRLICAKNTPAPGGGYTDFYYQYDSIGNMTYKSDLGSMVYGQNAGPHALTQAGGYTYQYDANGNMSAGKNKTLEYDAENRLISVNELGTISTFAYDGDGGRVKKSSGSSSTLYIGSLFEKDSSGKTTKYIFAGANRVAAVTANSVIPAEGGIHYYHSDHLGSSSIITDSSGNQTSHYEYTPYGSIAQAEGMDATRYKFTGKELDNTGLYFYGARYYDPVIGRFITADTIVQAPYDSQSLNRYSYCRNNPINYVDPTGHFFWFAALIFVAACAAIGAVANVAIAGATGQLTSWTAFWATMGAGAVAGAISGVGSFVPGAGTILGGILIGAVAGGAAGAVGSSISGAFSWGAVGLGAAYGGALGGFGNSSAGRAVGRALGKGIGKLPFGQHIQNFGRSFGNTMSQLYSEARGVGGSARASLAVRGSGNADVVELGKIKITAKEAEIYRRGTFAGNSNVKGEQWAFENPLSTPGYSQKYGLPLENSGNPDWVVKGHIVGEYGQGSAPKSYNNPINTGGATEIRINNPDDVQLDWFHMPDD